MKHLPKAVIKADAGGRRPRAQRPLCHTCCGGGLPGHCARLCARIDTHRAIARELLNKECFDRHSKAPLPCRAARLRRRRCRARASTRCCAAALASGLHLHHRKSCECAEKICRRQPGVSTYRDYARYKVSGGQGKKHVKNYSKTM